MLQNNAFRDFYIKSNKLHYNDFSYAKNTNPNNIKKYNAQKMKRYFLLKQTKKNFKVVSEDNLRRLKNELWNANIVTERFVL